VKFSQGYVLFCHITTQIEGEKHGDLLEKKGGQGFPHIVFMDADGNVLAEHQGERTADGFSKTGQKAKEFVTLKAKAEKGDKAAKIDFIIAQLSMGQLKPSEAEAKIKEAGTPTKEQSEKLEGEMVNASVLEALKTVEDEDGAKAVGKKFYEMEKAGKKGPTGDQAIQPYYILMMRAAEEAKDAAVFEKAMTTLKKKFGDNPNAKRFFEANEKKLEELKKK
jgi:hypothetical protein